MECFKDRGGVEGSSTVPVRQTQRAGGVAAAHRSLAPPIPSRPVAHPVTRPLLWLPHSPTQVRRFARMINPAALSSIAELFLMNGDMCAWLYTGSPAMHSEKITLFEPETSRLKKAGAGTYGNSFIAIRRCGPVSVCLCCVVNSQAHG